MKARTLVTLGLIGGLLVTGTAIALIGCVITGAIRFWCGV